MEAKDVWLLLASIPISYLAGLLTVYTAPSIGTAFGKLRAGFIERNKARALAGYALVWGLKSGQIDKYIYALNSWGFILVYVVFFAMCSVVGLLSNDPLAKWSNLGGTVFLVLLVFRRTSRLLLTANRLADFEGYRAQLLQRWPDLVLPE
jgi:hypothetical protein